MFVIIVEGEKIKFFDINFFEQFFVSLKEMGCEFNVIEFDFFEVKYLVVIFMLDKIIVVSCKLYVYFLVYVVVCIDCVFLDDEKGV